MPATTKRTAHTSKVEQIRKASSERFAEAEQVLAHLAANDERPTPEDVLLFASLGWDVRETRRQMARVKDIQRLRKQARTAAERKAARKTMEEVRRRMHEHADPLKRRLEQVRQEVNEKLAKLQADVDDAAAVCRGHDEATDQLRRRIPKHIRVQADHEIQSVKADYAAKINRIWDGIRAVERMQELDVATIAGQDDAVRMARNLCPHVVIEGKPKPQTERDIELGAPQYVHPNSLNVHSWLEFVAEQDAQVPEWHDEIEKLNHAKEQAVTEAERSLDYYLTH